jgi:hypothetical protein
MRKSEYIEQIIKGINSCVIREHRDIFKYIYSEKINLKFNKNSNGVFIALSQLKIETLKTVLQMINHGIAQNRKEKSRLKQQKEMKFIVLT